MKNKKNLHDWEKALLLLYVEQRGLPDWFPKKEDVQADVLMKLTGWSRERAEAAFASAADKGMSTSGSARKCSKCRRFACVCQSESEAS